jgi:holo-[acyl-carrier protein] synthase
VITGIGVDILEINRMQKSVARFGDRILNRIFTDREIVYCRQKFNMYQHLAARFAAKEALSKAISTGLRGEFSWKDIEVVNDELGKPDFKLHGPLREKLSGHAVMLSLSHSETHVVAMVIMEGMTE